MLDSSVAFSGPGASLWHVATFKSSLDAAQRSWYAILRNLNITTLLTCSFLEQKIYAEQGLVGFKSDRVRDGFGCCDRGEDCEADAGASTW